MMSEAPEDPRYVIGYQREQWNYWEEKSRQQAEEILRLNNNHETDVIVKKALREKVERLRAALEDILHQEMGTFEQMLVRIRQIATRALRQR